MSRTIHSEALAQVHELNRLFLGSLKSRDARGLEHVRFPQSAARALKAAPDAQIESLAEFPRALFRLRIAEEAIVAPRRPDVDADARSILELTILFSAWSTCRDSAYEARLFFGLATRDVRRLRAAPLSELPCMASTSVRLECAFADSAWLWRELLTENRPEARRQLVLVALQPSVEAARLGGHGRVAERAQAK